MVDLLKLVNSSVLWLLASTDSSGLKSEPWQVKYYFHNIFESMFSFLKLITSHRRKATDGKLKPYISAEFPLENFRFSELWLEINIRRKFTATQRWVSGHCISFPVVCGWKRWDFNRFQWHSFLDLYIFVSQGTFLEGSSWLGWPVVILWMMHLLWKLPLFYLTFPWI